MLYSATDLTLIIAACSSAIVGMIAGIRLSRCTHIKLGSCLEITREPPKTPPNTPNTPNEAFAPTTPRVMGENEGENIV
jgi:hypothetical protein